MLNTKSWDLGFKAAFLLVLTDQVCRFKLSSMTMFSQIMANLIKTPALSKRVGFMMQELGKSWVKLFVGIRTAPLPMRLPKGGSEWKNPS